MKTPKFLICENPIITGDNEGRLFILHTQDPIILAELWHYENISESDLMDAMRQLGPTSAKLEYGTETILFTSVLMVRGESFSKLPGQEQADKLAGIMRRMADWYEAYLTWEDQQ